MVRRRRLTALLAATTLFFAGSPAFAGAPTERLRDLFAKVNDVLDDPGTRDEPLERVARVRRLVAEVTDMKAAAATALGAEWDARTGAERDEFVGVFGDVLERAYVGRLAGAVRAAGGVKIAYGDEVVSGSEATVTTALRGLAGHDLRVEYRMTRASGRWRVRDIVVDGVSIVENYRAQFARLLRGGGYAALLAHLRAKLSEDTLLFAKSPRPAPAVASAPPADAPVVAVAPAEPVPAIAPSRPIVRAPRDPAVSRDDAVAVVVRPRPAEPRTRAAEPVARPVARRAEPAVIATVTPAAVSPRPAGFAGSPAAAEPDLLGIALGGLLISVVGTGGALAWRRRAHRRLWARVTRRARRPR